MKIILALMSMLFLFSFSIVQASSVINPSALSSKIPEKINLNTANSAKLRNSIKGIGEKRAEAIVKYRDSHTSFKSFMDLAKVPGLGKKFVESHLHALEETFILE